MGPPLGTPETGTICPYPITSLPIQNATSIDQCNQTMAEYYGSAYRTVHVLCLIISGFSFVVFAYRITRLAVLQRQAKKKLTDIVLVRFLAPMGVISFFVVLSSIDLWGMNNWISVSFYLICDKSTEFVWMYMVILLMEFWSLAVMQALRQKSPINGLVKRMLLLVSFIATVVAEVIGIFVVPKYYFPVTGAASLVFSVLIAILLIMCINAVRHLSTILRGTDVTTSIDASSGNAQRSALRLLLCKLLIFLLAGVAGFTYLFAIGIYYIVGIPYTAFIFEMDNTLSSALIIGRIIVWVLLLASVYMFRLPKLPSISGDKNEHMQKKAFRVAAAMETTNGELVAKDDHLA